MYILYIPNIIIHDNYLLLLAHVLGIACTAATIIALCNFHIVAKYDALLYMMGTFSYIFYTLLYVVMQQQVQKYFCITERMRITAWTAQTYEVTNIYIFFYFFFYVQFKRFKAEISLCINKRIFLDLREN